jgi:hypothetical protein
MDSPGKGRPLLCVRESLLAAVHVVQKPLVTSSHRQQFAVVSVLGGNEVPPQSIPA